MGRHASKDITDAIRITYMPMLLRGRVGQELVMGLFCLFVNILGSPDYQPKLNMKTYLLQNMKYVASNCISFFQFLNDSSVVNLMNIIRNIVIDILFGSQYTT